MSTIFSLSMEMNRLTPSGLPNPSRETEISGANGNKELFTLPVQLTTRRRIGNLTRLVHALAVCMCDHT